jgi:hypothetical protein
LETNASRLAALSMPSELAKEVARQIGTRTVNLAQFGHNRIPGFTDMTDAARRMHAFANENGLYFSYAGAGPVAIDANAQIRVSTSGVGTRIVPLNGIVESPSANTVMEMFIVEDEDTPLVTGSHVISGDAASTKLANSKTLTKSLFAGPGFIYVAGSAGAGPVIAGRDPGDATLSYRQSFAIDRNGYALHGLSRDFTGWTSIGYRRRSNAGGWVTIEGFSVDPSLINNGCIFMVRRNEVEISSIAFDAADSTYTTASVNRLIRVEDSAYIVIRNIRASAQQGEGTYVLSMDNAAHVITDDVTGIDGWGAFGTNHVNGWRVSNCNLNRVDGHSGLHNLFVTNTTMHDLGVRFGWGGGVIAVSDCHCINGPAISSRVDYGGYFYGDFVVDDITGVTDAFDWIVVDLSSNPVGPDTIEAPCPNIYVSGIKRNGRDDNTGGTAQITPVAVSVRAAGGTGSAMGYQAPAEVVIDGVYGTDGWRGRVAIDYANMIDNPLAFSSIHKLRVSRMCPTRGITAVDQGVYVPPNTLAGAGVAVDMSIDHCEKLALDARELGTEVQLFSDANEWQRLLLADDTRAEIKGGSLIAPVLAGAGQEAETVAVLGGERTTGYAYTSLSAVSVRGAWDISGACALTGVDISDDPANAAVVLPAGATTATAFTGWQSAATHT